MLLLLCGLHGCFPSRSNTHKCPEIEIFALINSLLLCILFYFLPFKEKKEGEKKKSSEERRQSDMRSSLAFSRLTVGWDFSTDPYDLCSFAAI